MLNCIFLILVLENGSHTVILENCIFQCRMAVKLTFNPDLSGFSKSMWVCPNNEDSQVCPNIGKLLKAVPCSLENL